MKRLNKDHLLRVASLALSAATLLLAALLVYQCASVYLAGISPENMTAAGVRVNDIYSREIVGERLSRISWAFVLWLALLALTLALRGASHGPSREAMDITPETRLALLKARTSLTPAMSAEERKRRVAALLCGGVCAVCAAMCCAYLFDLAHFASRDLETVMGAMLLHIVPWVALAFAALLLLAQVREKSLLREVEAAKNAPKRSIGPQTTQRPSLLAAGRVALYAAALLLIVAGILNGGMFDVLVKAINICTECIGLG